MERYTITAYIRCYQDPELVLKCASHLLWADEILVADNSGDTSVEDIISKINHSNIRYCKTDIVDWRSRLISLKDEVSCDYILMVDTDEYYTKKAAAEILKELSSGVNSKDGYIIPSESYLYCENYGKGADQLRLFRKEKFFIEFKSVHEMPKVSGPTKLLEHGYDHFNSPTLSSQMPKVFSYALNDVKIMSINQLMAKRTDALSSFDIKKHYLRFLLRLIWHSRGLFFSKNVNFVNLWLSYLQTMMFIANDCNPTEEARKREGKKYD